MAQAIGSFAPIDATIEDDVRAFDFTSSLAVGDSVASIAPGFPTLTCPDGDDPNPNSRLDGSATLTGNIVSQKFKTMLAAQYVFTVLVVTTQGAKLSLWQYLQGTEIPGSL